MDQNKERIEIYLNIFKKFCGFKKLPKSKLNQFVLYLVSIILNLRHAYFVDSLSISADQLIDILELSFEELKSSGINVPTLLVIDLNKDIDYSTDNFVVYYHGQSCNDGITSAWVTCAYLLKRGVNIDKIKFIDLNASKEIHERWTRFDDKKSVILFVDIAPSLHVYEKLKTNNKRIIVIDHHITNLLIFI
jgi:hypothetical protein